MSPHKNGSVAKVCVSLTGTKQASKPLGVACAACFEQLACVFASCGAMLYAQILASQNIKSDPLIREMTRKHG